MGELICAWSTGHYWRGEEEDVPDTAGETGVRWERPVEHRGMQSLPRGVALAKAVVNVLKVRVGCQGSGRKAITEEEAGGGLRSVIGTAGR
jgi:hypothetical protein